MNVFGKNERSWRKARKRGVSPIIATILLVAITVVLAAVLYVLISGLTSGGVGSKPIGSAITVGPNPSLGVSKCTAVGTPVGCVTAADYVYTLTVESSSVDFGNVLFEVKTAGGALYSATTAGGFTITNITGVAVASYTFSATGALAMPSSGFSTYLATSFACGVGGSGCSSTSLLTNLYSVVVDMGTKNPTGQGTTLTILGTGGYTGTTGAQTLS